MNKNQLYPTDLADLQWDWIKALIPPAKTGGHPRTLDMRAVINAILCLTVTGCQWRMLPREYPAWQSVYSYFRAFREDGTWRRIHETLRAQIRQRAGRHKHPTAGVLDSHSIKTTQLPGVRGYDAGKKVKGRKRHLLVDTLGLLLAVVVTSAASSVRSRWCPAALQALRRRLQETAPHLGGWRLSRAVAGVGPAAVSRSLAASAAPAGAERLCCLASALGGGTDLCLAHPLSTAGQRL
jgi:transposase